MYDNAMAEPVGTTSAKRGHFYEDHNPVVLVKKLWDQHPGDNAEIQRLVRVQCANSPKWRDAFVDYASNACINRVRPETEPAPRPPEVPTASQPTAEQPATPEIVAPAPERPKRTPEEIAEARALAKAQAAEALEAWRLNQLMPNGKKLRHCTGLDCSAMGGMFKALADRLGPHQTVEAAGLTALELKALQPWG
jgi:hypothetical protein